MEKKICVEAWSYKACNCWTVFPLLQVRCKIHLIFIIHCIFFSLKDKRHREYQECRQQLELGGGVLGDSGIPVVTNREKFPNELENLPVMILLNNGEILKVKKNFSVLSILGNLDHFGLRVLVEPFENEQELTSEAFLPNQNILEDRLELIFPFSDFSDEIVL